MQNVKSASFRPSFYPLWRRTIIRRGGPHKLHVGCELKSKRERAHRLDFEKCQDAGPLRRILWRKQNFADGEIRMSKCDGRVIGPNLNQRGMLVHINRHWIVLHLGADAQIAENLPGKNPRFKGSVLPAENRT